jgi:uncharacterized membrane protein YvbJ
MKICPNCGTENFCIDRRCKDCGTDLNNVESLKLCPKCETKIIENARYCSGCGTKITEMVFQIKKVNVQLL